MNSTPITIVGNVTAQPVLRFTASGTPVVNFSVAVTPRTFDKASNSWTDGTTAFFRVTAWRQLAENVAEHVTKGKRVIVTGDITARNWVDKDGNEQSTLEVSASGVGLDLTFLRPLTPQEETTTERPAETPKVERQAPLKRAAKTATEAPAKV